MKKEAEQLIVRRHSRIECDIEGQLRIAEDDAQQIVFSRSITNADGSVGVRVVDCSQGGLGLESSVYLPHGSHVIVEIDPGNIEGVQKILTFHLRVQRGSMVARSPRYYIGTLFLAEGTSDQAIEQLMASSSQSHQPPQDASNTAGQISENTSIPSAEES